jgi:hypothetical protein
MTLALLPRAKSRVHMMRRVLLLLAMAGIYVAIKRNRQHSAPPVKETEADAQRANGSRTNSPSSV